MTKQLIPFIGVSMAVLFAACSKPEPEAPADSPATDAAVSEEASIRGPDTGEAGGVDPTVADPDHYTAEFENDAVRILRIKYGPGEGSVMHYHPDSVAVFLTDATALMTLPDGSASEASIPAGAVNFNAAGEHQPKNIGDSAWEVVEVELKPRDPAQGESGGPDPAVVDPDHYTAVFENDQVRILRIAYGAGEASVMHYHPDAVAVFLTDHLVEMTMPDGSTTEIPASAGDAMFIAGGQHLPKNIADSGWELVLIELK